MKLKAALLLTLSTLLLSGCASVITGTSQVIQVQSEPQGAAVNVDGVQIGTTPRQVKVKRGGSRSVMVYKEGFEPETIEVGKRINAWVFGNILLGVLPAIIDMANGSWMWADPEIVMVTLRPKITARPEDKPKPPEESKPEEKKPEEKKPEEKKPEEKKPDEKPPEEKKPEEKKPEEKPPEEKKPEEKKPEGEKPE